MRIEACNQKKVCLVDPLSPYGHKDVNRVLIEQFNKCSELTVLCGRSLIDNQEKNVKYIYFDDSYFEIKKNSIDNRIRLIRVLQKMCDVINKEEFDVVFFSSYEIIVMSVAVTLFNFIDWLKVKQIFILNHSNIDDIEQSKIKRILYARLNKSLIDVCYEKYIGEHIKNEFDKRWVRVRHNISNYKRIYDKSRVNTNIQTFFEDTSYIYFIIPGIISNSDSFMFQVQEADISGLLESKRLKVFIKHNSMKYNSSNVMCYNSYLSDEEYSFIFDKCHYVGIIYADDYKYRVSGIFFDAVTFKKPIIYVKNMFFEEQEKIFGDIGIVYSGALRESIDQINDIRYSKQKNIYEWINDYYSDEHLMTDLKAILLDTL